MGGRLTPNHSWWMGIRHWSEDGTGAKMALERKWHWSENGTGATFQSGMILAI